MRKQLVDLTDRFVVGGLVLVILVPPIVFGAVHPLSYHLVETVIFAMLAALALRMREKRPALKGVVEVGGIALPALGVIALIGFQLVPLPPTVMHAVSARTYDFYERTLRGWPNAFEYPPPQAEPQQKSTASEAVILPTQDDVANGAEVPFTSHPKAAPTVSFPVIGTAPTSTRWFASTWRPISLSPLLGIASGLKLLAAAALFAIVTLYPVTPEVDPGDEDPLTRLLIKVILISGFTIAAIGLVQQVTWNGKILWFYIPLDWRQAMPGHNQRMMGPFVNPDHFAAYLAMTAPLFLSRALSWLTNESDTSRERDEATPILASAGLIVVICGILLSQSRAIWGATLVSCLLFAILASRLRTPAAFRVRAQGIRGWAARLALVVVIVGALAVALIGSSGRDQVDSRVTSSMAGALDIWTRVKMWHDTYKMFRDHMLLGVGFGAWPEVFPHYQRGPWPTEFMRNAHNDYVEIAAELGVLGVAAFLLIGWQSARLIWKRWAKISPAAQLTTAALLAGMAAEAFHEMFDFSLTIPAIGYLFVIYAALVVRIAIARAPETEAAARERGILWRAAPYAAGLALLFAVASQLQASIIYPYYAPARTFDQARTMVLLHPANPGAHLTLSAWYGDSPAGVAEVARAVWIDGRNPFARDLYARLLFDNGQYSESLDQIALSVMWSPVASDHIYLSSRFTPFLSAPDRTAIERGLTDAIGRGYTKAYDTLAQFYLDTGKIADAASTYERGASFQNDPIWRVDRLMRAGNAFLALNEASNAERCFNEARAAMPTNAEPYIATMTKIMQPRADVAAAQNLLKEGFDAGADPVALLSTFAQVAQAAGQPDKARAALVKTVEYEPTYDNLIRLGSFYASDHDYGRASEAFRRAADVDPQNPGAWVELAGVEDASYQYVAADRDYTRASNLDPRNADIRARYAAFKQKLAAARADTNSNPVDGSLSNDGAVSN